MQCLRAPYNPAVRSARSSLILALTFAAAALHAQPAPLVCATAPAGRPCEAFHFHVQPYRFEAKQHGVELAGVNQYATQAACDRARDLYVQANARAVDHLKTLREKYEADRVGPCHCDMTTDKALQSYIPDPQRAAHLRALEESRMRLRERLLDNKVTPDAALVRALWTEPPATPELGGPKIAPLPQSAPVAVITAPEDLRVTNTIDTAKPVNAALDLPLLDIGATEAPAPPPVPPTAETAIAEVPPGTTTTTPAPATPQPPVATQPPAEEVVVQAPEEPAPVPAEPAPAETAAETTVGTGEDTASAQETAQRFIDYEIERIQNVLRASSVIEDESVKSKIFEAAMQRPQLLSNLRSLIEGSGMRSRLAAAARDAMEERDRLELIGRLFGADIRPHWAPANADDVLLEFDRSVTEEPERVLRDSTASITDKKHALYLVLAKTQQPTEDQLLWLASIVEGFLQ